MKKFLLTSALIALLANIAGAQMFKSDAKEAKDTKHEYFVQLADSSIHVYESLKFKEPPMSYGYLVGDGKRLDFKAEEIYAFQIDNGYWLNDNLLDYWSSRSKKPIPSVPMGLSFSQRIRSGKLELYFRSGNTRMNPDAFTDDRIYYIKGANSVWLRELDRKGARLKDEIKSNKSLYDDFDNIYKKGKIKSVIEIIDEFNGK